MKKTILMMVMVVFSYASSEAQTGKITVNATEIEQVEGDIYFLIYKSDEGFPKEKDKAYKSGKVSDYKTEASYTFENIPYGTYAVAFFQDENGNGKLDDNFIGIPKEPVGASNMTSMGKPSFKKCKFELKKSKKEMTLPFVI
ncbi:DUF2141 domain-containing protein [Winogradskyella forsetii]|uniref:DUF2141 domain-containing protein n=1 Tax=Winogradskyella forsetii TaxID=2686077 RepID=UPI0015C69FAD|nr:DUF2141 domain-containing protein [Winogradskyella forsetii]